VNIAILKGIVMHYKPPCTLIEWFVNIILIVLKLGRRGMDTASTTNVGILMKDSDDGSMLRLDDAPSGNNGNVGNLMIVNALYIHSMHGLLNIMDIITSNATSSPAMPLQALQSQEIQHRYGSVRRTLY
jgi:hypothetical protein